MGVLALAKTPLCFLLQKGETKMIKKTISYTDYDGNERTEDFYFNLNKAELVEMNLSTEGGLENMIKKIVAERNFPRIVELFKKIILKAYGEKSPDGKRFVKSEELSSAFSQTEAYATLFMELASDADAAAKFINGVVPSDLEIPKASTPTLVN